MERKKKIISISRNCCNTLPPISNEASQLSKWANISPRSWSSLQPAGQEVFSILFPGDLLERKGINPLSSAQHQRTEWAAPIQGNNGLSPHSPAFTGRWNLFFTLQMDDIAISYDRQSRKVRQTAQGKADFCRKGEIKNQGEATAHPGRPSKAPNWCWNANLFYSLLKLMEVASLFSNFYNNKTGFY